MLSLQYCTGLQQEYLWGSRVSTIHIHNTICIAVLNMALCQGPNMWEIITYRFHLCPSLFVMCF